jgi:hypothetical protein
MCSQVSERVFLSLIASRTLLTFIGFITHFPDLSLWVNAPVGGDVLGHPIEYIKVGAASLVRETEARTVSFNSLRTFLSRWIARSLQSATTAGYDSSIGNMPGKIPNGRTWLKIEVQSELIFAVYNQTICETAARADRHTGFTPEAHTRDDRGVLPVTRREPVSLAIAPP